MFLAKVDEKKFNIQNDEQMVLDLLSSEKFWLVHGRAFNLTEGTYFRLVFLPHSDVLVPASHRIGNFFRTYKQGRNVSDKSHFSRIWRLKLINRWPLMHNVRTENVQEHSLQVAMVAHALALIKNKVFGAH